MKTYGDNPVPAGTAAQQRDAIRFLAQDHTADRMRVSDAEIEFLRTTEANVWRAAAAAVGIILSQLGRAQSKTVGNLSITQELSHYTDLRASLLQRGSSHQRPFAGALSNAEKDIQRANDDAPQPAIYRDIHEETNETSTADLPTLDHQE
jgi:hypothetical protein